MAASIADILRWDPEEAREVSRAANSRAMSATNVVSGLHRVPAFATWEGGGADAAFAANQRLHIDLATHGDDASAVGRAASIAADGMEKVQRDLRQLQWDAEDLGMEVEPASSQIVPGPGFRGTSDQLAANLAELQPRLAGIHAEAEQVEAQFASAIATAGQRRPRLGVQAVDFKQGPQVSAPGPPAGGSGPSGPDIAGVTKGLPQGTKPSIKLVQTQQQLEDFYKWAAENGTPVTDPYGPNPGTAYVLPDGTRVGMRDASGSTKLPAVDISYPGQGWEKIHINPTEGAAPQLPGARIGSVPEPPPIRAPVPVEPPPVEGSPRVGGVPIGGAPIGPIGPTVVPLPGSIHHLPVLGEDDVNAPWEYGE
jgi:hypothetical protein